ILEVLGVRARVVIESVQRIVDAGRAKQRERRWRAGRHPQGSVDDGVIHRGEVRRVEDIAQQSIAPGEISGDLDVPWIREVNGNRSVRFADFQRQDMNLNGQPNLLGQIGTEKVGPGYCGLIDAGPGHEAVRKTRVKPGMRAYGDANER